ncbi:MAG TPA: 50S ribosomal protein L9 [Clostridiales bacterium UBA8153]|nr:50S ribosomal protein L9 [Clostridiales bacterium UBA8153]
MRVILLDDVPGLGVKGAVVKVAEGYGRNYLLPRKLAILATDSNLRSMEMVRQARQTRVDRELAEAERLARLLKDRRLVFKARAGEGGRLFGSITAKDITEGLQAQARVTVDKKRVELRDPVRTLGQHEVDVRLHPKVTVTVKIEVTAEGRE